MGKDNKIKEQIREIDNDIADLLEQSGGVDTTLIKHLRAEKEELIRMSRSNDRNDREERRKNR